MSHAQEPEQPPEPKLELKLELEQVAQTQLPPKKYRIQTAQDIAGQSKFTTWYIQTLQEAVQAEPKKAEFIAAVNLCVTFLAEESNILGIERTIELFGAELVTACAWQARELHLAGLATEVTGRADRTVGGTFFYLLHKWFDAQPQANPNPAAQAQSGPSITPAAGHWGQLKIPYLYPKPADCVSPELAQQEPERVVSYVNLREKLTLLTSQVFREIGTASLADYAPPPASLTAIFTALSSLVVDSAAPLPSQPAQISTSLTLPAPVITVTNLGSEVGQIAEAKTEAETQVPAGAEAKIKIEARTTAANNATGNPAGLDAEEQEQEEKANPATDRAFLRVLANIYGEAAVYGTSKNPKPKSKRSNWS